MLLLSLGNGVAAGTTLPGMYALAGALTRPGRGAPGGAEARALTHIQAAQWAGATLGPLSGAALVSVMGTRLPLAIGALALVLVSDGLGAVSARTGTPSRRMRGSVERSGGPFGPGPGPPDSRPAEADRAGDSRRQRGRGGRGLSGHQGAPGGPLGYGGMVGIWGGRAWLPAPCWRHGWPGWDRWP